MIKNFLRIIIYSLYDFIRIFINLKPTQNFIIINPRIFTVIFKFVIIVDKIKKNIFIQKTRNYSDILTVYEVFSSEHYNLKLFKNFNELDEEYEKILNDKNFPLIIDCGSNIGSSSVYFNKIFPKSYIYSIEPDKASYEFSKKNINFNNSKLFNYAINCENTDVKFFSDKNDNRASKVEKTGTEIVKSIKINQIISETKNKGISPFLIKIDIEGFESSLFSKNYEWINEFKVIIIEIHDWMAPNNSLSSNFLNALVDTMNYKNKRDLFILGENLISIKINE